MKNDRTPRTLADAEYSVGHPGKRMPDPIDWSSWVMLGLFIAFLAMLYMGVL